MILLHFQRKPFNITVIQVYAPIIDVKEAEVDQFYKDLQYFLELTPKRDVLFIIGNWNAKVGSQEIPGKQASLTLEYRMKQGKGQQSFLILFSPAFPLSFSHCHSGHLFPILTT